MNTHEETLRVKGITFVAKDDATAAFMQLLLLTGKLDEIASNLPADARVAVTAPNITCKAVG